MYSLDFHEVELCQSRGDWGQAADMLAEAGLALAWPPASAPPANPLKSEPFPV